MAITHRPLLFGGIVFAYLAGSGARFGSLEPKPYRPDPRAEILSFAASLPRKVYPYSVVAGGTLTPEELAEARRSDPVVEAHFADFGSNVRLTRLQEDMFVYVSYRKQNKVYWTKKKHRVCKGELVLTDGKNVVRTRCANRVSKVFKYPNMPVHEPTEVAFNIPEPPPPSYDYVPTDPILTHSYANIPPVEGYNPGPQAPSTYAKTEPPGKSAANPGEDYLPSEVIVPQFLPFVAVPPAFTTVPTTPTPPPVIPVVPTPPTTPVPEPAAWVLVMGVISAGLLIAWARSRFFQI